MPQSPSTIDSLPIDSHYRYARRMSDPSSGLDSLDANQVSRRVEVQSDSSLYLQQTSAFQLDTQGSTTFSNFCPPTQSARCFSPSSIIPNYGLPELQQISDRLESSKDDEEKIYLEQLLAILIELQGIHDQIQSKTGQFQKG